MEGGKNMENFNLLPEDSYIDKWHDCYLSPTKKTGYVCTWQLSDNKQTFYGLNDLKKLLIEAKQKKKDVYLSLNAFEFGSRETKSLKQVRNIGVDLDFYKENITLSQALQGVKALIFDNKIPDPNLVIYSGRGLQLIYTIKGGASPKISFLTRYITVQFIAICKHLGADGSAHDLSRVFRLPFSVNGKNGKQVEIDIWNKKEFEIEELYSYCIPLEKRRKPRKPDRNNLKVFIPKKGTMTLYSLNTGRLSDLDRLVALRKGNIENRNVLTYVYAYTLGLILKLKGPTVDMAIKLNYRLVDPQPIEEVKRTAGNAFDDAMAFFKEFEQNDFKMWYKHMDGIKRPMKTSTVIEKLDIQQEEMKVMETIINKVEKQARDTNRKREQRGSVTREEYVEMQQNKSDELLKKLQEVLTSNPKIKKTQLAKELGIHRSHLYRLMNQL
jgi:hypothetical protein